MEVDPCSRWSFTGRVYLSQELISEFQLAEGLYVSPAVSLCTLVHLCECELFLLSSCREKHTNDLSSNPPGRVDMAFQRSVRITGLSIWLRARGNSDNIRAWVCNHCQHHSNLRTGAKTAIKISFHSGNTDTPTGRAVKILNNS